MDGLRDDDDIALEQEAQGDLLLLEDVGLDLIDRRLDLGEVLDVQIAVGAKVRYADGANFTGCLPCLF